MMKSFTAWTPEAVQAVIDAQASVASAGPYAIELGRHDFEMMMRVLEYAATDVAEETDVTEWAESFGSAIAETLGIEFI